MEKKEEKIKKPEDRCCVFMDIVFAGEVEKQAQDTRSTARHQDAELAQHGRRAFREGAVGSGLPRDKERKRLEMRADKTSPKEKRRENARGGKCGRVRWNEEEREREKREGGCSCETSWERAFFCWLEKKKKADRVEVP